jgi:hypothetical protein
MKMKSNVKAGPSVQTNPIYQDAGCSGTNPLQKD